MWRHRLRSFSGFDMTCLHPDIGHRFVIVSIICRRRPQPLILHRPCADAFKCIIGHRQRVVLPLIPLIGRAEGSTGR
jgi:hypothetical protein